MGIDWCWMRLRPDASLTEVRGHIETQAATFEAWRRWWDWNDDPDQRASRTFELRERELLQEYAASSHALRACLVLEDADYEEFDLGRRVYSITENLLLPGEWRREAMRTYLPEDLSAALKLWRAYFRATAAGDYQPYLKRLYLSHLSLDLFERWRALMDEVQSARARTNAWAKKPALIEACERIEGLRSPTLHPAPLWSSRRSVSFSDGGVEQEIVECVQYNEGLVALTRAFDARVPGNWKVCSYSRFPSFQAFTSRGEESDLQEYLTWLEGCCAGGYVLFLDY